MRLGGHIYASPDGRQVAFNVATADEMTVCVVGIDGTGFRQFYRKPRPAVLPLGGWSPDGRNIILHVVGTDASSVVGTISVQDGSVHTIPGAPVLQNGPSLAMNGGGQFTPDGRYVVFAASHPSGANTDIRILALDGSYQGKLVDHPSRNVPLGFAPDAKHFLFQSDRSGKAGIYAIAVVNGRTEGEPVLIAQKAGMFSGVSSITRQGALFYGPGEQNQHEVFALDLSRNGVAVGNPQPLSGPYGMVPESAAWSPDGRSIAFISGRDHTHGAGEVTLTVRNLASGQDTEWKTPAETDAVLGWAADGSAVYTSARYYKEHGIGDPKVELHSVPVTTGKSAVLATIPGTDGFYFVGQARNDRSALLISYGGSPNVVARSAQLIRKDLRTGEQTQLIAPGVVSEMSLSPDGKQVAALDRQANYASVLVKPLDGGGWKTLARLEGTGYMYVNWLPDGDLVFGREGRPNAAIYRLSAGGGAPQKVAELTSLEHIHENTREPQWAATGVPELREPH